MILTDEQIFEKYAIICPSCNRNGLLPYQYEWTCYLCNYNIIKQKHELTLLQRKKLSFASRIKYAEQKIIAICTDIIQIYDDMIIIKCLKFYLKLKIKN